MRVAKKDLKLNDVLLSQCAVTVLLRCHSKKQRGQILQLCLTIKLNVQVSQPPSVRVSVLIVFSPAQQMFLQLQTAKNNYYHLSGILAKSLLRMPVPSVTKSVKLDKLCTWNRLNTTAYPKFLNLIYFVQIFCNFNKKINVDRLIPR